MLKSFSRTISVVRRGWPIATACLLLSHQNRFANHRSFCQGAFPATSDGIPTINSTTGGAVQQLLSAKQYFQNHGVIPRPPVMHSELQTTFVNDRRRGILVVGDVHGCYDELIELHKLAVQENDGYDFHYVILVGDLCNKGPHSARVIRHVRTTPRWLSVRGNHDDGSIAAFLGDVDRQKKKKYQWIFQTTDQNAELSDEDKCWLMDLPYTITIPSDSLLMNAEIDTVIVHAGIIPDVRVKDQAIEHMITIREIKQIDGLEWKYCRRGDDSLNQECVPWATVWKGPPRVIFGHDARRGLQRYDGEWAIGLDTGACYGNMLTGIILPQRKLVHVQSYETYSPTDRQDD